MKKWIVLALQTLVSVSLLAWIFHKEEFREQAWTLVTTANPAWLLAGLASAGLMTLLGAVRWGIFLRVMEIRLPVLDVLRLSYVGLFFNNFLVGAVGGDAVKVVWLCAKGHGKYPSLVSVLLDRMSGVGAIVIGSATFMLLRLDWLRRSETVAHLVTAIFCYLGVLAAMTVLSYFLSHERFNNRLPENFPGRARLMEFTTAFAKFFRCWPQTLAAAGLSVLILIGYFTTFYCAARAFGVQVPVLDLFAFLPVVDIISALPVSLGGFGVREELFAKLFYDLCGVSRAQAVSISLGGALLSLVWGLVGLLLLPSYRRVTGGRVEP